MDTANKNYGFQFDEPNGEDFVLGFGLPYEVLQEGGDWSFWLPQKEFQNLNGIEPSACVSFTTLNCVEILIRKKYGEERNYSDRFLAAISGTTSSGNTPKKVADALRHAGVARQEDWPFNKHVDSFEKFYAPLPEGVRELALEFIEEWDFGYEIVPANHGAISAALKTSPLLISFSAWFEKDGLFYRPEGMRDNHATTLFREDPGSHRTVFDSYDNHIKNLRWQDVPMAVKRFTIKKRVGEPKHKCWLLALFSTIWQ